MVLVSVGHVIFGDWTGGGKERPTGTPEGSPFDSIRQVDDQGEFWSARDLMPMLGYGEWRKFDGAIDRAMATASNSGASVTSHFADARKMVRRPQGGGMEQADYRLTRYACYLVAMNGDPRKPEIAAAQTYFAVKTREAELIYQQLQAGMSQRELAREIGKSHKHVGYMSAAWAGNLGSHDRPPFNQAYQAAKRRQAG